MQVLEFMPFTTCAQERTYQNHTNEIHFIWGHLKKKLSHNLFWEYAPKFHKVVYTYADSKHKILEKLTWSKTPQMSRTVMLMESLLDQAEGAELQ